jgi:hypothetical protein
MYNKRLQIDAGVNIMRALSCLDHFIAHYLDSHIGSNHAVAYASEGVEAVVIYQTDKSFIVRKG